MPVDPRLLARAGELKLDDDPGGDSDLAGALDRFLLQHRQADGRTLVEHYVDRHPKLPSEERALLLGWRDVVEGLFEIKSRDRDALLLRNLIDELTYRTVSNMGPATLAQFPVVSFLYARLVPIADEWMLSGSQRVLPASGRREIYRAAAEMALRAPSLAFRNPEKLAQAREFQRKDRGDFIAFFGADEFVVPGRELPERMRAFMHFKLHERRDDAGRTAAERVLAETGKAPEPPELELQPEFLELESVGVIYDEDEGISFLPDYGRLEAAFADPSLLSDPEHRDLVRHFLEHPSISPTPLRRLAARYPASVDRVFRAVLRRPEFSWEREGEALLRRHKAEFLARPPLPTMAPSPKNSPRRWRRGPGRAAASGATTPAPAAAARSTSTATAARGGGLAEVHPVP